tara:strand:- start:743 stop:1030 length:288 start_codon:yes stop_codon:yes gene_type:complete
MNNDLIILVKKYFDKVNGNTYHSVQFEIDNKIYHSGKTYGYERQYEQTFKNMEISYKKNATLQEKAKRLLLLSNPRYIVIENCKAKELKEIHNYK